RAEVQEGVAASRVGRHALLPLSHRARWCPARGNRELGRRRRHQAGPGCALRVCRPETGPDTLRLGSRTRQGSGRDAVGPHGPIARGTAGRAAKGPGLGGAEVRQDMENGLNDVVTAWLEQEEAFLARQRSHGQPEDGGLARPEDALPLTGLEMLQGMIAGRFPAPPIAYTLRFFLLEVSDGHSVFQGEPRREFFNPLGTVHGGWFATLLDSALGCAVHTTILP